MSMNFDLKTAHEYKDLVDARAREIVPHWDQLARSDALKILSELVATSAASIDQRLAQLPDLVVGRIPGILGMRPRFASPAEALLEFRIKADVKEEITVSEQLEIMIESVGRRLTFRTIEPGLLFNYGQIHLHLEKSGVAIGFDRIPEQTNISLYIELERSLKNQHVNWSVRRMGNSFSLSTVDGTDHFSRSGLLEFFTANLNIERSSVDGIGAYWLHGQLAEGAHEIPIRSVVPNVLSIANLRIYRNHVLGSGTGLAGQRVKLPAGEIVDSFSLRIFNGQLGQHETWEPVQTLFLSSADSRHFYIDYASGELVFGDGVRGRKMPPGYDNILVEELRVTDGVAGNVASLLTSVRPKRDDWRIENVRLITDATGGRNGLAEENLVHHMHTLFRNKNRAVTLADFQELALESNPRLGRVFAREGEQGVVKMIVVLKSEYGKNPKSLDHTPYSSDLELVREALESKRMLNTRLEINGPVYRDFNVRVRCYVRKLNEDSPLQIENAIRTFFAAAVPGERILQERLLSVLERLPFMQNVKSLAVEDMRTGLSESLIDLKYDELPRLQYELNLEEVSV